MRHCVCGWLDSRCVHAGAHPGRPYARSQSPESAFRRKRSRYFSASSRNQRHHSRSWLRRAWRRMAQTEIKFVGATISESLPPCFYAPLRCSVSHSLHLCGQHSAKHSLGVDVPSDRSSLSCWFVCCFGRNANCFLKKQQPPKSTLFPSTTLFCL